MSKAISSIITSKNASHLGNEKNLEFNKNKPYICIDWFQFTIKNRPLDFVINLLGLDDFVPHSSESGLYGYNRTLTFFEKTKIMFRVIYFEGQFIIDENMGYHVIFSGRSCREYEQNSFNLIYLFEKLFNTFTFSSAVHNMAYRWCDCNISRIDYALDYFTSDTVCIKKLLNYVKKGQCTSIFKKAINTSSIDLSDGKTLSNTLYFGSPSSNIRIVFYDKLQERNDAGYKVINEVDFWERCEIRLKQEKASESLIYLCTNDYRVGDLVCGTLRRYLQFRKKGNCKQRNIWPIFEWWQKFTGEAEPLFLSQYSIQSTLQQKKDYVETHWTSLISEIACAEFENIDGVIKNIITNPKVDITSLERINNYRISKGKSILSQNDLVEIVEAFKKITFI